MDKLFSHIGLGTSGYEKLEKNHAVSLLQHGIDVGLTHIDTAEMYGWGEVEKIVGEALAGRRDQAFIGTKVWPIHTSSQGIEEACERSLKSLKTDYIDLYTVHWPGPYPLAETMDGLLSLQQEGKINHIGLSNFTAPLLKELIDQGYSKYILTNQVMYNLNERLAEQHVFDVCRQADIRIVGYSPLSGGKDFLQNEMVQQVAQNHQRTPHQVALNFLSNDGDITLIPKATQHIQVTQIAESLDFSLTSDEHQSLKNSLTMSGPQDGVSIPIDKGHYFRGDYDIELRNLFEQLKLNPLPHGTDKIYSCTNLSRNNITF